MQQLRVALTACAVLILCVISVANGQRLSGPLSVQYQYPANGATAISRQTNIIIRPGDVLNPSSINSNELTVTGSFSGKHAGSFKLSDDKKTVVFTPHWAFTYSERVTVKLNAGIYTAAGKPITSYSFYFAIQSRSRSGKSLIQSISEGHSDDLLFPSVGVVHPAVGPVGLPKFTVTQSNNPSPGNIFVAAFNPASSGSPDSSALAILDNAGNPIWYRTSVSRVADFKLQSNGLLTYYDWDRYKFYAMDSTMRIVDSFATGGGFTTDIHDIELLPHHHALLMAYDTELHQDLSQFVTGGNQNAGIIGLIVQEIDSLGDPVMTFNSLQPGGFTLNDLYEDPQNFEESYIDAVHGNSLQMDTDGNILVSSRHLDQIVKISRDSGAIIWRWGGKRNEFTLQGDSLWFSHQHHVRRIANGHITVFDNGNDHRYHLSGAGPYSRALEYALDEQGKTARLVWEYDENKGDTSGFMGSVQRLANGNTFIGWGGNNLTSKAGPGLTEVDANGKVQLEMYYQIPFVSYRAFKYDWTPAQGIAFAVPHYSSDIATAVSLSAPYPNPASGVTNITVNVPTDMSVDVRVFDQLGHEVASLARGLFTSGPHEIPFDCSPLPNGVYHCVLSANGTAISKAIVVAK